MKQRVICKSTLIELDKGILVNYDDECPHTPAIMQFDVFAGGLVHMISVVHRTVASTK